MRKKIIAQRAIFDQSIDQLNTLIRPERIFKQMDAVIDQIDSIVARIHKRLTDNVSDTGNRGMSAEQILRVALVRQLKQYSWRELAERLNDGICLRWFTRFYSAPIPHFTTLQKAVRAIDAELWSKINDDLIEFAQMQKTGKRASGSCRYNSGGNQYCLPDGCPVALGQRTCAHPNHGAYPPSVAAV